GRAPRVGRARRGGRRRLGRGPAPHGDRAARAGPGRPARCRVGAEGPRDLRAPRARGGARRAARARPPLAVLHGRLAGQLRRRARHGRAQRPPRPAGARPGVAVRVADVRDGRTVVVRPRGAARPREPLRARPVPRRPDARCRRRVAALARGARGPLPRAGRPLGGRPRPAGAGRHAARPRPGPLRDRALVVARERARHGAHAAAVRAVAPGERVPPCRRALPRRGWHDPGRGTPDVPHQRRARRQAAARRDLGAPAARAAARGLPRGEPATRAAAPVGGAGGGPPVTGLAYLAALAVSLGGLAVLDRRFRLAFWADPRRAGLTVGLGVVGFLAWDVAGLALGIFARGESPWMTGLLLAPDLPVEEAVFLTLLCYNALLVWRGAERVLAARRARAGGDA